MLNDMMLHQRIPRLSRLSWLMALYAENYRHLKRLFAPGDLEKGSYRFGDWRWPGPVSGCESSVTAIRSNLRLTYELCDPMTGEPDPSAYVRLYCDALQVETTHCYVGRRWQDVIGLSPLPGELMHYRMRMNIFSWEVVGLFG